MVCMQFTLNKILSKIFLFITCLILLVIPLRIATNSAGPGTRLSTTDSAQHVYPIRTPYESKPLACMKADSAEHVLRGVAYVN